MDVIFMGTPDYADVILKRLIANDEINVVAVYTQPDKPVGRKKVLTPPPVKVTAKQHDIALFQPKSLREPEAIESVKSISCDYIVVAAYGQILPREILDHAPCINLHASILPQYRGASPIQQTLLNGDKETGVTAMLMEEGLDTGDILKIEKVSVCDDMMVEELFEALTQTAAELTVDVLKNFQEYKPQKQNDAKATHCKKITKADGLINFDNAATIYNKYRAFTPWPGIYLESGLKLKKMALESREGKHKPGAILSIDKESIVVGCQEGSLRIFRLQPPSKKEMDAIAYVNGKRLSVADTLA
ncbi:MAG: methionyl-tRNA formyltransferase [Sulfurimonas sp.]